MSDASDDEQVVIKPEPTRSASAKKASSSQRQASAGPSRKGKKRARTAPDSDEEQPAQQDEDQQNGEDDEEEESEEEDDDRGAPALIRGEGGYVTGSIVRMIMHNFVTYDHVEFRPGPDLNMILGPNGNGKSTIAYGIAIGLGFPLSVLNRQTKISQFVKNTSAESEGWIEIELKGKPGERNQVIRRHIHRDDEKTNYTINGQSATAAAVKELMAELNVQVNNLCTFLPQDRVASFAQLSIQDLLKETEKAAGDARLHEWHMSLASEYKNLKEYRSDVDRLADKLKRVKDKQAATEKEVTQFRARKELEDKVKVLELILPFAEYQAKRVEIESMKGDKNQMKEDLAQLETANKPMVDSHNAIGEMVNYYEGQKKSTKNSQAKVNKDMAALKRKLDNFDDDAAKVRTQIDGVKNNQKSIQEQFRKTMAKVNDLTAKTAEPPQVPSDDEFVQQLNEIKKQRRPIEDELSESKQTENDLKREVGHLQRERGQQQEALKGLQNVQTQRDRMCEQFEPETWYAVKWLRQNRDKFRGKVYEPPRLTVSLSDLGKDKVDLAEAQISRSSFRMFIFELRSDYDIMMREMNDKVHKTGQGRNERRVRIDGYELSDVPLQNGFTEDQLQAMGFDCVASDLIKGPEDVIKALCATSNLHRTPISFGRTPLNEAEIAKYNVSRYYTPQYSMSAIKSKYNGQVQTESRSLQKGKVLGSGVDTDRIDLCKKTLEKVNSALQLKGQESQRLDELRADLNRQLDALDKDKNKITKKRDDAKNPLKAYEKNKIELRNATRKLKELSEKPSEDALIAQLRDQLAKQTQKRVAVALELASLATKSVKLHERMAMENLRLLQAETDHSAMGASFEAKRTEIMNKKEELNELTAKVSQLSKTARTLYEQLTGTLQNIPDELREKVEARRQAESPDLEKINAELAEHQARLSVTLNVSSAVLKQYEQRQKEIEESEEKLETATEKLNTSESKSKKIEKRWVPKLKSLVEQVSAKFSAAFDHLGALGEVRIHEDPDYDKWGIQIMVAFRDTEQLKPLTGQRQSGGERALCTVMYLMALAGLAKAPFALVDEINQGMDQRVERNVHSALVKTTCDAEVGQYFLITPKLLPNLDYHPKMKVLIIHNGSFLSPDFKLKDAVDRRLKRNKANGKPVAVN